MVSGVGTWGLFFFSSTQKGVSLSTVLPGSPLACILKNWDKFGSQTLKKKHFIFFCLQAWPQYTLSDGESWPPEGSINFNTILQLDRFCKREGKWCEVPYVQIFFILREDPKLCQQCKINSAITTTRKEENLKESPTEGKEFSANVHQQASCPPYPGPFPSAPVDRSNILPLQEMPGGDFGPIKVYNPFSLQDLRQT